MASHEVVPILARVPTLRRNRFEQPGPKIGQWRDESPVRAEMAKGGMIDVHVDVPTAAVAPPSTGVFCDLYAIIALCFLAHLEPLLVQGGAWEMCEGCLRCNISAIVRWDATIIIHMIEIH